MALEAGTGGPRIVNTGLGGRALTRTLQSPVGPSRFWHGRNGRRWAGTGRVYFLTAWENRGRSQGRGEESNAPAKKEEGASERGAGEEGALGEDEGGEAALDGEVQAGEHVG